MILIIQLRRGQIKLDLVIAWATYSPPRPRSEKLTPYFGGWQNEEDNSLNRIVKLQKLVKSELKKNVQGRNRRKSGKRVTGTRRITVPFRQIRETGVSTGFN